MSRTFNERMQPASITASTAARTVFSLGYDFHDSTATDNGNIWKITNNLNGSRNQVFTYDYLNRLATGAGSGTAGGFPDWGESYTYDMWANLQNLTITKVWGENPPPTADNHNHLNGYCYDAAGNLLDAAACPVSGHTYTYNDENELTAATFSGATTNFDYDADGRRVSKSSGTMYWYGKDGEVLQETDLSGTLLNEYIFLNGERVARRNASGNVFYYFEDQIGSTRIMTTSSGTVCYDADFFPFGGIEHEYTNTCPQNYKFTGKERDAETGFDYFGARYYSSGWARFITPDWAASPTTVPYAKFGDPQSLNLYGYVENEPVNRMDPDGHAAPGNEIMQTLNDLGNAAENTLNHTMEAFIGMVLFPDQTISSIGDSFSTAADAYGTSDGRGQMARQMSDPSTARQVVFEGVMTGGVGVAGGARGEGAGVQSLNIGEVESVPRSIPASGPKATAAEKGAIQSIGNKFGCHECGAKAPGTKNGRWIADHQPPTSIANGRPQVLKPHCQACSTSQGYALGIGKTKGVPIDQQ